MCVPRSPQGQPVLVQAGGSEPGRELAAETADMVYSVQSDFDSGRAFYADLKGRMAKYGREPHELKIMPGIYTIVGSSAQEAEDKHEALRALVDEAQAKAMLSLVPRRRRSVFRAIRRPGAGGPHHQCRHHASAKP